MKRIIVLVAIGMICASFISASSRHKKNRVLVFSATKGFRHSSIKDGIALIQRMGVQNNFDVDTTENPAEFNYKNLKKYSALIFLNPTGEVFTESQQNAFKKYIHHGGGFVGIHAATDCLYKWPWYGQLVGAYFAKHPKVQAATVTVTNNRHLSTIGLPASWTHTDEWYNFKSVNPDIKVLMTLDESSYKGGEMGYHPVAWYHEFEGGRAFYTALGHTSECYKTDEIYQKHLLGGIKYAMNSKD